ncbi:hypothetical protein PG996_003073 [Apiospora saccharicola]|uniref:Uncharacterized protein n=1 Tax=Apiospora saccharicola TaxID=335842 RepID=A0ABR1W0A3_9PEZI
MRFFSGLILVTAAIAKVAFGVLPDAPLPGYGVEPVQWAVEVAPGQTELFNGTVQQVHEKILQINPKFKLNPQPRGSLCRELSQSRDNVICLGTAGFQDAWSDGVEYLRNIPDSPTNGPGPGNCGRVSCSDNSAIWWCNDNTAPLVLERFGRIADAADAILKVCFVPGH